MRTKYKSFSNSGLNRVTVLVLGSDDTSSTEDLKLRRPESKRVSLSNYGVVVTQATN